MSYLEQCCNIIHMRLHVFISLYKQELSLQILYIIKHNVKSQILSFFFSSMGRNDY